MEKGTNNSSSYQAPSPLPSPSPPHVLIFPFPIQGHVNSMLNLAELLCLSNLNVTFLNSSYNHHRLLRFTDVQARFSQYPNFRFKAIDDGVSEDQRHGGRVMEVFEGIEMNMKPGLRKMLGEISPPVDCVIGDGVVGFVVEVGVEVGIPVIHFRTIGACCFWAYFCTPDAIDAGELPIRGEEEDMDRLITKVPGMETFLRCRDLPSFCRAKDITTDPNLQLVTNATRQSPRAHALILNTFEHLEQPILSRIRTHCPNTYTIGPLHLHLRSKHQRMPKQTHKPSSNSLWEENRSCLSWLDDQPPKSVLYVCFGSITLITTEQLLEFWHGLLDSNQRFLWVIRLNSVTGDLSKVPKELVDGVVERDFMVIHGWVPQEEVLRHDSIGGFLTHSGWNSTLESVAAGVPMICWPYFADQQVNSRFVSEVWKLGLDMKDVCDRRVIGKMVKELMVERKEEFLRSAALMAELAMESVSEGGSSSCNLDRLIEYIRLMSLRASNRVHV